MQIKVFSKDKTFKRTLNPDIVMNELSISKQINWWEWEVRIAIDTPITSTLVSISDIIEVHEFSGWLDKLIYVWFVDQINLRSTSHEDVELIVYGLASLLQKVVYKHSWSYTATLTWDPWTLISWVVDYANSQLYGIFEKDIDTFWTSVSFDTNYANCMQIVKNLSELAEWFVWFLDGYTLRFFQKPTVPIYIFTLQKDIMELNIEDDSSELVNTLILTYKTGTKVYTDSWSVTLYWARQAHVSDTSIWDVTTADLYASAYFAENANPKRKVSLTISPEFTRRNRLIDMILPLQEYIQELQTYTSRFLSWIKPWESCTIKNTALEIWDNLIISKTEYNQKYTKLYLESYDSIISLINKTAWQP